MSHLGADLPRAYRAVRTATERLAEPLSAEDCAVQSMEDASPTKWHLAHTSWYFETFVLEGAVAGYRPFDPAFRVLFNSYYNGVGDQYARPQRGLLSRPGLERVFAYRQHVDRHLATLLDKADDIDPDVRDVIEIGIHHEQQHQELILTDLKHMLSMNPTHPVYRERPADAPRPAPELAWIDHAEGLREIGHDGAGFSFDNERPRHRVFVGAFQVASRPVTNGEYLAFVEAGGYREPSWWLADGWATVGQRGWQAPLYWERSGDAWQVQTLAGLRDVAPDEPVCHLSYYEADAYARFAGARLPTEAEWEVAARAAPVGGNFVESGRLHPAPAQGDGESGALHQVFGDVWEWTASPYVPYPGFRPPSGALGEYNGKFMSNQLVLRGGSCATPASHIRPTYRNFFYPDARWQFSGVRLARDA
ncbi:MAG: ergothioneine biosynthesis protein EgtB [Myxococcota bacterium]